MGKGNGHHIPNTPIVVDYWKIKGVPPKCVRFLTHMHSGVLAFMTCTATISFHRYGLTTYIAIYAYGVQVNHLSIICSIHFFY